jgi:hypothetical protein
LVKDQVALVEQLQLMTLAVKAGLAGLMVQLWGLILALLVGYMVAVELLVGMVMLVVVDQELVVQ